MLKTTSATPASRPSRPAIAAFLCLMFALPLSDGSGGQILSLSFMLLLFTVAVLWCYRQQTLSLFTHLKTEHKIAHGLFWAWLVSSSLSLISVLISDVITFHKIIACLRHLSILLYTLYVFALARFCIINRLSHIKIFTVLIAGVVTISLLYVLIYHFGPTPDGGIWAHYPPFGSHVRNIGNVAAVATLIALLVYLNNIFTSRLHNFFMLAALLCCCTLLVWLGGRSSIALVMIISAIIMAASFFYARASLKRGFIIIAVFVAAFIIADQFSVFEWNGIRRAVEIHQESSGEAHAIANDKFTSGRLSMWTLSLNAFKTSPWLGLGPYGYYFIPGKMDDDQPHNIIVQFLVEWGIIGTGLMLALLGCVAWHGLKQLPDAFRERDFGYIAGAAVVLLLTLDGLTAGTYFKFQPMVCLATAFAVFPYGHRKPLWQSTQ